VPATPAARTSRPGYFPTSPAAGFVIRCAGIRFNINAPIAREAKPKE